MLTKMKRAIKECMPHFYYEKRFGGTPHLVEPGLGEPEIYNEYGEKMRVFYLKDSGNEHTPYRVGSRYSKHIMWDQYNYTLPIHFYGPYDIKKLKGSPYKKFLWLNESESIVSEHYERLYAHPETAEQFDAIFTFSEKILDQFDNAKLLPFCDVWYASPENGGVLDPLAYEKKIRNISMILYIKR